VIDNYRTVALLSHVDKVLMMVSLERLKTQMEVQTIFRRTSWIQGRQKYSAPDPHCEANCREAKRKARHAINCFIDFQKAFDLINNDVICSTFRLYGVGTRLVEIQQNISERAK